MEEVTANNLEGLSFDTALEKLEEKVRQLEEGQLPLEEALECFKEGISLVRLCGNKLNNAETVIQQLIEKKDGAVEEQPFEGPEGGELD